MQVGPTKDILNHEHINNFENNSLGNVNLNISNGVMPLHNTIEYQISNSGFSAVAMLDHPCIVWSLLCLCMHILVHVYAILMI